MSHESITKDQVERAAEVEREYAAKDTYEGAYEDERLNQFLSEIMFVAEMNGVEIIENNITVNDVTDYAKLLRAHIKRQS